ncbi:uncharacterized protein LOC113019057 [Astatotilapia calliptera]|uniref:uncharacterized protein LOC113019057 n=1 Tax=Astatotilapia calliptera TaxID=8154 RepID=UPI000E3FCFE5|nr:uncharacterized protein LOC113019057 [Astatotilapia calliptera]
MSATSVRLTYIVLLLLLLFIGRVSGKLIQAAAGDDVRFALTEKCKTGKVTHQLMDGTDQLVAFLDGVWKPGPGYINRVVYSADSLILKRADFNDHGYYEFTCNSKQRGELEELHVFLPYKLVAPRDEGATLPCRSVTVGQAVKSVRWRRDGELVLELNPRSKQITYGDGYDESRVSIPSDWYQRGDLSLTVKRAQLRDDGVYYCYVENTEKHRSAVHLHVSTPSPPPPGSTSQPTTTPTPSECSEWSWRTFFITAAVFVIVDLLVWLGWFLRDRKFNVCTRGGGGGTEEGRESDCDQHRMLKSNGNPDFTHN